MEKIVDLRKKRKADEKEEKLAKKTEKRKKRKRKIIGWLIFIIIAAIVTVYMMYFSPFAIPGTGLKGEFSGQTNVLILGKGGETHAAGELTDSIQLAIFKSGEDKMAMLSIPRDLWVNPEGFHEMKINAVYSAAKNNGYSEEEAIKILQDVAEDITGLKPHYYAMVDFGGLGEIINSLGGIDVPVYPGFTDTLHNITYPEGINNFTGEEAIMFSRARYADNGEGSDFQRTDRQQDMIKAIAKKAMSLEILTSPPKISKLKNEYEKNIETNVSIREMSRMKAIAGDLSDKNIIKSGYSTSNVLISGKSSGGAYVLYPKSGFFEWTNTRDFASKIFET